MKPNVVLAMAVLAAACAFGQIDAFSLRAKFGPPLDRETFTVRGVEIVVDYGSGRQVCRIRIPSGTRMAGDVPPGTITKEQVDQILNEVVPLALRGKELNRMSMAMGVQMMLVTDYEKVSISETQNSDVATGITITFKDSACSKEPAH